MIRLSAQFDESQRTSMSTVFRMQPNINVNIIINDYTGSEAVIECIVFDNSHLKKLYELSTLISSFYNTDNNAKKLLIIKNIMSFDSIILYITNTTFNVHYNGDTIIQKILNLNMNKMKSINDLVTYVLKEDFKERGVLWQ
jgi:hypothetical protein